VTDGLGNIVNLHVLSPLIASANGGRPRMFYKGFMGDALLGFALKREMWGAYDPGNSCQVHLDAHRWHGVINYEASEQQRLFTGEFLAEVGNAVADSYRHGMERAHSSELANQRLYFDLTQRVPRMTLNGVEAARTRAVVRLPYCDNDLLDFALNVPPGFLFERHLAKAALVRYFPKLAKIPLAGTGRPLVPCARDVSVS
jgi:hypothetical protein